MKFLNTRKISKILYLSQRLTEQFAAAMSGCAPRQPLGIALAALTQGSSTESITSS
jgi:hypothetical protein